MESQGIVIPSDSNCWILSMDRSAMVGNRQKNYTKSENMSYKTLENWEINLTRSNVMIR